MNVLAFVPVKDVDILDGDTRYEVVPLKLATGPLSPSVTNVTSVFVRSTPELDESFPRSESINA